MMELQFCAEKSLKANVSKAEENELTSSSGFPNMAENTTTKLSTNILSLATIFWFALLMN